MIKEYYFFEKNDKNKEPIFKVKSGSRLVAAKYFAEGKHLKLKEFLKLYTINK